MQEIICFGTGYMTDVVVDLFQSFDLKIRCWVDNNPKLWGTTCRGIIINSPDIISRCEDRIFISCIYIDEISEQLSMLGYSKRIITAADIIMKSDLFAEIKRPVINEKVSYVFDVFDDKQWAGTELWSLRLASHMKTKNEVVKLVAAEDMQHIDEEDGLDVMRMKRERSVRKIINELEKNLPLVFINSFSRYGILAAIFMKLKYPEYTKIVSVMHCDDTPYLLRHSMYKDYVDAFFCVSERVKNRAIDISPVIKKRIYNKMQPVEFDKCWHRDYSYKGMIKVAYAARLERKQKRADLLPQLIALLEKNKVTYHLDIAGSGECYSEIDNFICSNGYDNITLLGQLDAARMPQFWKEHDVYVNFSAYEGCSLSMLEAMSYGCVPIVSDVSGVDEIVCDGENGYICHDNTINEFEKYIGQLSNEHDKLKSMSQNCREIIQRKCNYDEYTRYIMNILDFGKCK